jgi:serine/threonine protein phosphatase PrpC
VGAIPSDTGLRSVGAAAIDLSSGLMTRAITGVGQTRSIELDLSADAGVLLLVVDGMACPYPGQIHPFRADASTLALDAFEASARAIRPPSQGEEAMWLTELFTDAEARALGVGFGALCSSIAFVLVRRDRAWVAHAGDVVVSRSCRGEPGPAIELTRDHTLARALELVGASAEEVAAAKQPPLDNVLTSGFGWGRGAKPELCDAPIATGDVLWLASRSFTRDVIATRAVGDGDLDRWHSGWLAEAVERGTRSPVLLLLEKLGP